MDLVCNRGPNQFKPCRLTPPFGGDSVVFGKTSIDCPPFPGDDISSKGLDILFNPTTTGVTTWTPTYTCNAAAFSGNACFGGTSEGRPCTQASECPGRIVRGGVLRTGRCRSEREDDSGDDPGHPTRAAGHELAEC